MNKTLGIALVVVIVIATIGAYQYLKVEQPLGANPGPDIFSFLNVHGVFSQGGGVKTVLQTAEGTHTLTFAVKAPCVVEDVKVMTLKSFI